MKRVFKIVARVWIVIGIACFVYMYIMFRANLPSETLNYLEGNSAEDDDYIIIAPKLHNDTTLIFLPGALVDPMSYGQLGRKLAEYGYQTIIVKMPFRMATKGYTKVSEIDTDAYTVLAGHSQGAKMAAQFVYENPDAFDKLILIGTTHPRDIDISDRSVSVMKIYGTNDGIAEVTAIESNRDKLPATTKFVEIAGGNHSQFGYYGFQFGDRAATIDREAQHDLVVSSIRDHLLR